MPPTLAAARTTISGFSTAKNLATAVESARSSSLRSRVSRFVNPRVSRARVSALPTMPRWPATKILSVFSNGMSGLAFSFLPVYAILTFVQRKQTRLAVQKTYKLLVGGKFVRGESGRVLPARDKGGELLANFCRASKKDFRDAVVAARSAFPNWAKQSAYLRGQILYRAAEMLEMRRGELQSEIARSNSNSKSNSASETALAIDR